LQPGFIYRFNYDDVIGVNVLEQVSRAEPLRGEAPLNAGLSIVNNPR